MRNHNTVSRDEVIKAIAQCVPTPHKVDLVDPEIFVLVEIFKVSNSFTSTHFFSMQLSVI